MRTPAGYAAMLAGVLLLVACTSERTPPASDAGDGDRASAGTSSAPPSSGVDGRGLPKPVSVADAGGESLEAGPDNDFAVAAAGGIWVTGVPPGIVRYDAATGEITRRIKLESSVVQALDAAGGKVWVTGQVPDVLLVLDEVSGQVVWNVELPMAPLPESSVATDGEIAWVLADPAKPRILRVDPASGKISRLPAPDGPESLRFGSGSLWATTYDAVERLDPDTGESRASIATGPGSSFLTFAHGAAWVLGQLDGTVWRVDARSEEVTPIPTSDHAVNGGDIAAGDGFIWSRTWDGVTIVDPDTREAVARIATDGGSGSVAATNGWLWITDHDHSAVHRVPWPPG
jgi:virginiamycin B lyase